MQDQFVCFNTFLEAQDPEMMIMAALTGLSFLFLVNKTTLQTRLEDKKMHYSLWTSPWVICLIRRLLTSCNQCHSM